MGIVGGINGILWGVPMLSLMLVAGAYFSVRTGFFQLRRAGHCLKKTVFSRQGSGDGISPVQAMFSALAGTLGTGSITGVSTALTIGGAGAVFWMWLSALLGMMTGFAENTLGAYYRRSSREGWRGGAMYYIRGGLEKTRCSFLARPLAAVYAGACVLSAFGMGSLVQMNSAASALRSGFGVPEAVTGIVLAGAASAVIFGGVKRLGSFTSRVVPVMSGLYIAGAVLILAANIRRLPELFSVIMRGAFSPEAAAGGVSGYLVKQAVSMGVRRGVFSNEAGLGSSVAAHAGADIPEPCVHGMWSMLEVGFNTIVMCSMTALTLLSSPCRAADMQEVFNNVSLQPQYFRLTEESGLICGGTDLLTSGNGELRSFRTACGQSFTARVGNGGLTCSNVMKLTGIQAVDDSGAPLYDSHGSPLICGIILEEVTGTELVTLAFGTVFGGVAGKVLSAAMALFAFSTITGRSIFGAQAAVYLFGSRAAAPFRVMFILCSVLGAFVDISAAWGLADMFNGLMAAVNLPVLLALSGTVMRLTRNYCARNLRHRDIKPELSAYPDIQQRQERSLKKMQNIP